MVNNAIINNAYIKLVKSHGAPIIKLIHGLKSNKPWWTTGQTDRKYMLITPSVGIFATDRQTERRTGKKIYILD